MTLMKIKSYFNSENMICSRHEYEVKFKIYWAISFNGPATLAQGPQCVKYYGTAN